MSPYTATVHFPFINEYTELAEFILHPTDVLCTSYRLVIDCLYWKNAVYM